MPPIRLNRRRFLGCSAAAGWALSQGRVDGSTSNSPVRVGMIGLGTRGTTLLRTMLELEGAQVVALCDAEERHLTRASGIVEKAKGTRPDSNDQIGQILERPDVDALVVALPCDLHASTYRDAILAGKHLYGEKPLALTLAESDLVEAEAAKSPELVVHVGYQRRSNPRYREGVALARRGDLGSLVSGSAEWISSNGPMNGHDHWLASRARSGDWMIEQAVHIWDVFGWIKGTPPARAFGHGRRDLFARLQPDRDVTDDYAVQLEWSDGFRVAFTHSWVAPADDAFTGVGQRVVGEAGGLDLTTGSVTYRDKSRPRQTLHPGPQPDTRLALQNFLEAIRSDRPTTPPITLAEAREATAVGLLVRRAVDERRVVSWDEIQSGT
ncbi:Gfo/Idh/MocA family protein [Tundrisphaera lichenicola]|uniref:Gfo/Idh/MocA family protein n=1 Tax=Tundrisphaera lichenicola TaxID=2029860 RepID=UPI003EB7B650